MIKHKCILGLDRIVGSGTHAAVSATMKGLEPVLAEMAKRIDEGHSVVIRMNLIDKDGFIVGKVDGEGEVEGDSLPEVTGNDVAVIEESDEAIIIDLDDVDDPFEGVNG